MEHHHHDHGNKSYSSSFVAGTILNIIFVAVEIVYGITSGSLALLSDAGHNFSDVLSLLASWIAVVLGKKKPTKKFTYGLKKSTVLAALFNAVTLLTATGAIILEAIKRLINPINVNAEDIIIVALIGVVVNAITALLFTKNSRNDLNIKSVFLHMAYDSLISLGVALSGVLILLTHIGIFDSIVSLLLATIMLYGSWKLLKESTFMAIDSVPHSIDLTEIANYLTSFKEITCINDIHVWNMSTSETALTAHLVKPHLENDDEILKKVIKGLKDNFGITHITIQLERDSQMCEYKDSCSIKDLYTNNSSKSTQIINSLHR